DELTQLGEAMASVRQSVQAAIGAQLQMAEQHEAGAEYNDSINKETYVSRLSLTTRLIEHLKRSLRHKF
ncbi:hypothetical protein, partial [Mesorhizobium sp. M1C.F.Ca.ET.176.01.1.1]|uniref:hypothetical protein n=1 Tax=Mesorhizobium sp. M1C.F.Ca.ET.176.01.1.1 TaxID=2563922 RepID=UPI0016778A97